MREPNWAVFISGTGSNLAAILDAPSEACVRLVVSSKADAYGLLRAKRAGIPTLTLEKKIDWSELDRKLRAHHIDYIFLAGFMRIVPAEFIGKWRGRILNVHPSLLPNFPGLHSIEKAFQAGGPYGVTVHEVTEGVDEGPIVLQRQVNVPHQKDVTLEQVEFLYHLSEHRLVRESVSRWKRDPR